MYLRRAALDEVGLFDAQAFPQGYGEENDWCRRAAAGRAGASPQRALAGLAVVLLSLALGLEQWPSSFNAPRFQARLDLGPDTTLFVGDGARLESALSVVHYLARSPDALAAVLQAAGCGVVENAFEALCAWIDSEDRNSREARRRADQARDATTETAQRGGLADTASSQTGGA